MPISEMYIVSNALLERIQHDLCLICNENMDVPVLQNGTACCNTLDGGAMMCIACARTYLQLDKPKQERGYVKHLICSEEVPMWEFSAADAYTVPVDAMRKLDSLGVVPPPCSKCKLGFDSFIALYAHRSPGSPHLRKHERVARGQACTATELPAALAMGLPGKRAARRRPQVQHAVARQLEDWELLL